MLETAIAQEPIPLIPKPLCIELTKKQLGKDLSFSSALISVQKDSSLGISTIQGGGISIYNINDRICLHSISVPADTTFAAPALFLPESSSALDEIKHDFDGMDLSGLDEHVSFGNIYAAMGISPSIPSLEHQRQIWMWECRGQPKFNQPLQIKRMETPIRHIALSKNSVIVCQTNGDVTVLSKDLQETLINSESPFTISKVLHAEVSTGDANARVCIVAELPDGSMTAFIHTFLHKDESVDLDTLIQLNISVDVSLGYPRSFSYNGRQLCLAYESLVVKTFYFKSQTTDESEYSMSSSQLDPSSITIKLLNSKYTALMGCKSDKDKSLMMLYIWDNIYGTLQYETALENVSLSPKPSMNIAFLDVMESEDMGSALLLSLASKSSSSRFQVETLVCPIHCPALSLKSTIGRLRQTDLFPVIMEGTAKEIEDLDRTHVESLLKQTSVDTFEADFMKWIAARVRLTRSLDDKFPTRGVNESWSSLPIAQLSHASLVQLSNKCFASPSTFWPTNVIAYLIKTNMLNSHIITQSIIKMIIEMKGTQLLALACKHLVDISESDWVLVIKSVLELSDTSALDRVAKGKWTVTNNTEKEDVEEAKDVIKMSIGQEYFLYQAFSSPCNDQFMVEALRKLSLTNVESLLSWLGTILAPDTSSDKANMWWMWGVENTIESQQKAFDLEMKRWNMALDALALIVDAHMVSIIVSPRLVSLLKRIQTQLDQESEFYGFFHSRVYGLLKPFTNETQKSLKRDYDRTGKGQRWRRMVNDIQDDTGSYCIEVLRI